MINGLSNYGNQCLFIGPCLPSGQNYFLGPANFSGGSISNGPLTFYPENGLGSFSGLGITVTNTADYSNAVLTSYNNYPGLAGSGAAYYGINSGLLCLIQGYIYVPSTNQQVSKIKIGLSTGDFLYGATVSNPLYTTVKVNEWERFEIALENHGNNQPINNYLMFQAQNSANSLTTGVPGDYFRFKEIKVAYPNKTLTSGLYCNLLQQLNLVQSVTTQVVDTNRNIVSIGQDRFTTTDPSATPTYSIDIEYLLADFSNESKIGLNVNFFDRISNTTKYPNNTGFDIFQFITGKNITGFGLGYLYPFGSSISKNLYLAVGSDYKDEYFKYDLSKTGIDNKVFFTHSFGNCYLNSYSQQVSVGELVRCSVNFIAENYEQSSTTYGKSPSVSYTGLIPNNHTAGFVLPKYRPTTGVYALLARNIDVSIECRNDNISWFSTPRINAYNLTISLPRLAFDSLNFKHPVSRDLIKPFETQIELRGTCFEHEAQNLDYLFNERFILNIDMNRCSNLQNRITLGNAKLVNLSFSTSIDNIRQYSATFTQEVGDFINSNSIFLSGTLYNNPVAENRYQNFSGYRESIDLIYMSGNNIYVQA